MQFQATLCLRVETFSLSALIDSGADENFLDSNFASQAGIPVEQLAKSMNADALDGRLLAHHLIPSCPNNTWSALVEITQPPY